MDLSLGRSLLNCFFSFPPLFFPGVETLRISHWDDLFSRRLPLCLSPPPPRPPPSASSSADEGGEGGGEGHERLWSVCAGGDKVAGDGGEVGEAGARGGGEGGGGGGADGEGVWWVEHFEFPLVIHRHKF